MADDETDPSDYDDNDYGDDYTGGDLASVVRVGRNEDVAAICGRVDTSPTYAVVVHAPNGNRALATELGIRRLQRHAEEAGKLVAIATGSVSLASRARQAGIPTARRPEQVRWDAGGKRVLRFFGASMRLPSIGKYLQYLVLLAFVGAIVGGALAVGPSTKVVAYPPTETLERLITVSASTERSELDVEQLLVPANLVSADRTLTLAVKTTGTVNAPTRPSRVAVTITNPSDGAVELGAGTTLLTNLENVRFALEEAVTIDAKGSVTTNASSLQRGAITNVPVGAIKMFEDERYRGLTVTNSAVASGGANEDRPAVDPADILAIRALANEIQTSESVLASLVDERPRDAVFLKTATATVEMKEPHPAVGAEANILTMDVVLTISAQAILESTLDELARAVLVEGQGVGTFIPGTVSAVETGASQVNAESGEIRTQLRVRGEFAREITEDAVRDAVKGKSTGAALSTLANQYGIQEAELKVTPGWAPRIPRAAFRIDVELRNHAAEDAARDAESTNAGTNAQATASPTPRP